MELRFNVESKKGRRAEWVERVVCKGLNLRWVDHGNHSILAVSRDAAVDPLGVRILDAHCPCGGSLSWRRNVHGAGPERIGAWLASIVEVSKSHIMRAIGKDEGDIVSNFGLDDIRVVVQTTVGDLDLDCLRSRKAAKSREGVQRDAFNHVYIRRSRPDLQVLTLY